MSVTAARSEHQECTTCFFTTRFPDIVIGQDGRCNRCQDDFISRTQKKHLNRSLEQLHALAAEIKTSATGKYHCVVGSSGGLDSSYVAYVVKKVMGLNPLLVRYDSGLSSPEAARNFESLCQALQVDHRVVRSRGAFDRRYIRHFLRAAGDSEISWGVCRFCSYVIHSVLFRTAVREGIPALFTSHNIYEGYLWLTRSFKLRVLRRAFQRQLPWGLPRMAFHLMLAEYNLTRLKLEFFLPPVSNLLRRSPKSPPIRHVTVSRYVPWDIEAMVRTLEKETGWRPPHASLPMRFDCMLEDGQVNHTFRRATGLTVQAIIANNLIHGGVRTKDQLVDVVRHYDTVIEDRKREVERRLAKSNCPRR